MPYTISFEESSRIVPQIRAVLRSFPEVTVVASEHGRPDDGTDPTGFFNAEFYVGLKPYSEWTGRIAPRRSSSRRSTRSSGVPGHHFNYTQPAEDAVNEAETGLKSSLDVKVFGTDLELLEKKGREIKQRARSGCRGITHVTLVQELGQPSLTVNIDRAKIARYGINVDDMNGLIEAAVGGSAPRPSGAGRADDSTSWCASSRSIAPHARADRQHPRRDARRPADPVARTGRHARGERRLVHLPRGQFAIHRRAVLGGGTRPRGRGAGCAAASGREGARCRRVTACDWGGEYEEYTASRGQLQLVLPVTIVLIFLHPLRALQQFQIPLITVVGVVLSAPIGGIVALWLTGTPFSVSSGIGFLALFGVSVQTAVVYISYVNELRRDGMDIVRRDARGRAAAAPADHDDGARRGAGPASRRNLDRRRDPTRSGRSRS